MSKITHSITPEDINAFYIDEVGPAGWFSQSDALDATITSRFMATYELARDRLLKDWLATRQGTLALVILLDQFPRNMFREDGRAFATDSGARKVAKFALSRGDDIATAEPARSIYYMPLMHAECNADQDASVRAFKGRSEGGTMLLHARAHREIIRKFGRFPTRNIMMSRTSSAAEQAYLDDGGYGKIVDTLSAGA
ncbi:DUF924 domain-containing protein [Abyssibius alkaniclasticus]|uniref:DUF924 family protein n=1 Tax=Abyssibius alkaniclasticus TaxID=2881234 RepID=UPI002363C3C8|nr:DUF924 family protein [Abyssibius alkaniclasticus]UPH70653.1 DUF924 domain-containing protein [Abyssibius alkaniclasticus]